MMDNSSIPAQPPVPGAQPKSNNTTRIVIIIVAVLAVLCLISCAVGLLVMRNLGKSVANSVQLTPENVAASAEKIATFTVPSGFNPSSGMSILGMTFVIYEGADSNSALIAFQMPTAMEITEDNIKQLQNQMQQQSGRRMENFQTINQYDTTIRGKPAKVVIQEGSTDKGTFRQMMVVFQGKSGLAMIYVIGPADSWDQAAYDKMVKSIK